MKMLILIATLAIGFAQPGAPAQSSKGTSSGPIAAPVSIVMYADLECPFSAATLPQLEKVVAQHATDVHMEVRQFPLDQHKESPLAHEAALAAGAQGKYLAMANLIQANQKLMDRAQYLRYAAMLHLNLPQFTRDLDGHRFAAQVQEDLAEGLALGVDQTPTLFVNGKRLAGAQDAAVLNDLIERSLIAARMPAKLDGELSKPLAAEDTSALAALPTATMGAATAPVTIVEFTDFQCPFCRRAEDPLRQLLTGPEGKNVRLIYRSYPLDFHAHAEEAAEAALAAGDQGKFWPMHDLLFANQTSLDRAHFDQWARQIGLDVARFDGDLDSGKYRAAIAADRALGQRYGVDGTPAFFINGRSITGARTLPELQQAVQLAMGDNPAIAPVVAAAARQHVLNDHAQGVTVDWYIDLEAAASPAIGPVLQDLAARPSVRVALHSYALPNHPNAPLAYRALLAAIPEGKFWTLYNALAGKPLADDETAAKAAILAAVKSVTMDTSKVSEAMQDKEFANDVAADQQEAFRRGVRGVPVIFIGGKRVDGIQPETVYTRLIEQAGSMAVAEAR